MNKKKTQSEVKQRYFFPLLGISIEAGSLEEAQKLAAKQQENGDGE